MHDEITESAKAVQEVAKTTIDYLAPSGLRIFLLLVTRVARCALTLGY